MKRKDDNLFRMLRDAIMGDPIERQRERVEAAVKAEAEARGDVLVAKHMRDYYSNQARLTNPEFKWRQYADLRDKQQAYSDELEVLTADHDALRARADAEKARLLQLLNGPAGTGSGDTP